MTLRRRTASPRLLRRRHARTPLEAACIAPERIGGNGSAGAPCSFCGGRLYQPHITVLTASPRLRICHHARTPLEAACIAPERIGGNGSAGAPCSFCGGRLYQPHMTARTASPRLRRRHHARTPLEAACIAAERISGNGSAGAPCSFCGGRLCQPHITVRTASPRLRLHQHARTPLEAACIAPERISGNGSAGAPLFILRRQTVPAAYYCAYLVPPHAPAAWRMSCLSKPLSCIIIILSM